MTYLHNPPWSPFLFFWDTAVVDESHPYSPNIRRVYRWRPAVREALGRLLCRLGRHDWLVTGTACGQGFDREFAYCLRCDAQRHVDYGIRRTDVYFTEIIKKERS